MYAPGSETKVGRITDQSVSKSDVIGLSVERPALFLKERSRNGVEHLMLLSNHEGASDIPLFSLCLNAKIGSTKYMLTDLRPFASREFVNGGQARIRNKKEAFMFIMRSVLEDEMMHNGCQGILDTFPESSKLYGVFVASLLAASFNLEPYLSIQVRIIAEAYYLNIMSSHPTWAEAMPGISARIAQNRLSSRDVSLITSNIHLDQSIDSMISSMVSYIESPRIKSLSLRSLSSAASLSYFGHAQSSVPMIAMESPALWIPLMSCVYDDRSKSKCKAASIITNYSSRSGQFDIKRNLFSLLSIVIPSFDKSIVGAE